MQKFWKEGGGCTACHKTPAGEGRLQFLGMQPEFANAPSTAQGPVRTASSLAAALSAAVWSWSVQH